MPRDRRLNASEVEAILRRYGFILISQKGSHRKFLEPDPETHNYATHPII
jgi:predicted RNA binding protein YcfA (HicA-like mRNA interferase family)